MDYFNQFIIPYAGLKLGEHQFNFEITDEFFKKYDYSDLRKGNIQVGLILEREERMLILNFDIDGSVEVVCDRCLDLYDQVIHGEEHLFFKFGDDFHEESDEIIVIQGSGNKIDVGHYIYEFINLLLPYRLVHPDNENGESGCNKEFLQELEEQIPHDEVDPRWEALKKLKNELENK